MPAIAFLNLWAIGIVLFISAIELIRRPRNRGMEGLFVTAFLSFLVLFSIDNWALSLVSRVTSVRYDQFVFCFDRFFGSPSFFIGRLFITYPLYKQISLFAYMLAPSVCLAIGTVYFFLCPFEDAVSCVRAVLFACLLAYPVFAVFPVAGPLYAFPSFPSDPPLAFIPQVVHLYAVPNGVPSVHMTLALIVFWFARRWKLGVVLGLIFVLLTISATLGLGEHYLFDLLVAVPYTVLVNYLAGYSAGPLKEVSTRERTQTQATGVAEAKV
jgi:hypothetical protein